jgi:two-component system LytT family response regulator
MPSALIVDDEPNARERIRALLARHPGVTVAGECGDGIDALAAIRRERPQLLLLDVQMPGLDGFGVLAHLRPREIPVTVFITAFDEHAIRAFEVGAADYVLKPIVPSRFDVAVTRAIERIERIGERTRAPRSGVPAVLRAHSGGPWIDRLIAEKRGRLQVIPLGSVRWLASEGNYVRIQAADETYLMRATLGLLERRLDPARFARIHRSSMVALRHVSSLEPGEHGDATVHLQDGTALPVSRKRARELRERLREKGTF